MTRVDTLGRRITPHGPSPHFRHRAPMWIDEDWPNRAACREHDPEHWFPPPMSRATYAKNVCNGCPVVAQCLEWALVHREDYGVWGNKTQHERDDIRRQRRRATR